MSNLQGKKLLLLGGVQPACEIVKEAHNMGVTVYVTDYLEDSPAKKYADKSFMVNATDADAVAQLCSDEKIDGLITGYVDLLLPYAEKICRKCGFPFWGNAENIDMSIDKYKFKFACEKSDVPVVPWRMVTRENYHEADGIEFPVVIKPVDNSGSRGVFKCYRAEDFEDCCEKAFAFSKIGKLLVEKLMDAHKEFSVYYILSKGEALLTGMGDRYVNIVDDGIAPEGQGMCFPSVHLGEWIENCHPKITRFFRENGMNEGFVFLQGFYDEGSFYIHEIGYRLNGGFSYKLVEHFSGYNQIQELIRFSLTGSMDFDNIHKSDPYFDGKGFILTLSLCPGEIASISGVDKASKTDGVVGFYQLHSVGDKLMSKGTTAQVFAYVLCAAKNKADLERIINDVKDAVRVNDTCGNSMLRFLIDPDRIVC